jgi:hypothetical protein
MTISQKNITVDFKETQRCAVRRVRHGQFPYDTVLFAFAMKPG